MCSSVNSLNKTTVCTQTKLPLEQLRTFRNQLKRTFTLLINQLVHKSEKKQIKRLKIPPSPTTFELQARKQAEEQKNPSET